MNHVRHLFGNRDMIQLHYRILIFLIFVFAVCGCAQQKPPSYEDLNIRFSNVRTSGKCDDARSLEVWITQIYSYYDMIQTVRDRFASFSTDKTSLTDVSGLLSTTHTDFNRLMPPECAAQAYYYANYALYLANDFLPNKLTKTNEDAEFIVYLLDLFLSEQKDLEADYEAMLEK